MLSRATEGSVEGPESPRARAYLQLMEAALDLGSRHRMAIEATIPAHAGLGSGTQLALAVATALRTLHGLPADPDGDAARLGRGARSGVGSGFFSTGGLVVDGGKADSSLDSRDRPPPVVARLAFPPEWRVILVLHHGTAGLHGEAELAAFAALPPFPQEASAEICRLVLMQALPGIAERDLAAFGGAITTIQSMVGGHFAPAQGGVFTSPAVAQAMRHLAERGATGIGQSSWGPTGFAFAESVEAAEAMVAGVSEAIGDPALEIRIVAGRNSGAVVERLTRLADAH